DLEVTEVHANRGLIGASSAAEEQADGGRANGEGFILAAINLLAVDEQPDVAAADLHAQLVLLLVPRYQAASGGHDRWLKDLPQLVAFLAGPHPESEFAAAREEAQAVHGV